MRWPHFSNIPIMWALLQQYCVWLQRELCAETWNDLLWKRWLNTDHAWDCADLCAVSVVVDFFARWIFCINKGTKVQFLSLYLFVYQTLLSINSCSQHKVLYFSFLRHECCSETYKAKVPTCTFIYNQEISRTTKSWNTYFSIVYN